MENFTSNILFSLRFEIGLQAIVFGPTDNQSDRAKAFSFLFKHLVKLLPSSVTTPNRLIAHPALQCCTKTPAQYRAPAQTCATPLHRRKIGITVARRSRSGFHW